MRHIKTILRLHHLGGIGSSRAIASAVGVGKTACRLPEARQGRWAHRKRLVLPSVVAAGFSIYEVHHLVGLY